MRSILRQLFTWNADGRKENLLFAILFAVLGILGLLPAQYVFWVGAAFIGIVGGTEFFWLAEYDAERGFILPYIRISLAALGLASFIAAPWHSASGTYLLECALTAIIGLWFLCAGVIAGMVATGFRSTEEELGDPKNLPLVS
jgi:hypothetical protein